MSAERLPHLSHDVLMQASGNLTALLEALPARSARDVALRSAVAERAAALTDAANYLAAGSSAD